MAKKEDKDRVHGFIKEIVLTLRLFKETVKINKGLMQFIK